MTISRNDNKPEGQRTKKLVIQSEAKNPIRELYEQIPPKSE